MTEPDVTLTDFALALECLLFAVLLTRRARTEGRIAGYFALVFLGLATGSVLGATYHGFFSEDPGVLGKKIWLATMLSLGAMTFANWLVAAEIFLPPIAIRVVQILAAAQLLWFTYNAIYVTREYDLVSNNTLPAMGMLFIALVVALIRSRNGKVALGVAGMVVAVIGTLMQQKEIGFPPLGLTHNALYHVVEGISFMLIYSSIAGLTATRRSARA